MVIFELVQGAQHPWCLSMKDRKVRRQAVIVTCVFVKLVMEKLGLQSSV